MPVKCYYVSCHISVWPLDHYLFNKQRKLAHRLNQSILTKGSWCKLNAKKTIAHDAITHCAMVWKILQKIIDLATQIELTLSILMIWLWNLLRNLSIHFHNGSYSATYLLRVTGLMLWQSQFHNISSLLRWPPNPKHEKVMFCC